MVAQLKALPNAPAASYQPDKEYVATGGFFSAQIGFTLSALFLDDAEFLIGPGGFERLLTDPEVHKDVTLLIDAILGDGVQLYPNFTDEKADAAKAKAAAEYQAFCALNLFETPHRPFRETLNESVKAALVTGHKVVEKTYRDYTDPEGRPRLVIDKLKVKPRNAVQFVVDQFWNELGMMVWGTAGQVVVPREKFFIPTFDRRDEDPRGSAPAMRAIYNWWLAKRAALPVALKRLEKKALPSVVGFTSGNEEPESAEEFPDGTRGTPQTPAEVMANKLAGLDNFSAAAFPNGASVTALNLSGNGSEFVQFIEMCDSQITRASLLQDLATNQGKYGTRAQAKTHMEVLALRIWNLKNTVADAVRSDILKDVLYLNYGPDSIPLTPAVTLGDTERRDWALDAAAAALIAPYVPDSVWATICRQLGLPMPEETEEWPSRVKQSGAPSAGGQTDKGMTNAEGRALHANMVAALRAAERLTGAFKEAA
jgi:hypothetical protein